MELPSRATVAQWVKKKIPGLGGTPAVVPEPEFPTKVTAPAPAPAPQIDYDSPAYERRALRTPVTPPSVQAPGGIELETPEQQRVRTANSRNMTLAEPGADLSEKPASERAGLARNTSIPDGAAQRAANAAAAQSAVEAKFTAAEPPGMREKIGGRFAQTPTTIERPGVKGVLRNLPVNTGINTWAAGDDIGMALASDNPWYEKAGGVAEAAGNVATGFLADRLKGFLPGAAATMVNAATMARPVSAAASGISRLFGGNGDTTLDILRKSQGEDPTSSFSTALPKPAEGVRAPAAAPATAPAAAPVVENTNAAPFATRNAMSNTTPTTMKYGDSTIVQGSRDPSLGSSVPLAPKYTPPTWLTESRMKDGPTEPVPIIDGNSRVVQEDGSGVTTPLGIHANEMDAINERIRARGGLNTFSGTTGPKTPEQLADDKARMAQGNEMRAQYGLRPMGEAALPELDMSSLSALAISAAKRREAKAGLDRGVTMRGQDMDFAAKNQTAALAARTAANSAALDIAKAEEAARLAKNKEGLDLLEKKLPGATKEETAANVADALSAIQNTINLNPETKGMDFGNLGSAQQEKLLNQYRLRKLIKASADKNTSTKLQQAAAGGAAGAAAGSVVGGLRGAAIGGVAGAVGTPIANWAAGNTNRYVHNDDLNAYKLSEDPDNPDYYVTAQGDRIAKADVNTVTGNNAVLPNWGKDENRQFDKPELRQKVR